MKVAVCCIIKQENLYLRDFVEYYKKIGFDNVILWDNNDEEGEYPQQVIGDYISSGFVIYEDCRGKYRFQLEAYELNNNKYGKLYDWIAYFDCDEFIELTEYKTIKPFLSQEKFNDCGCIVVYWRSFGDSGLLHYDKRPVYERFTSYYTPSDGEKCAFKLILRQFSDDFHDVTFPDTNCIAYLYEKENLIIKKSNGKVTTDDTDIWYATYDGAILNHYHTLTIEEFLYRRFGRRSYADTHGLFNKETIMNIFKKYNEMTEEKQKIIDDFFAKFSFEEDNNITF